MRLDLFICIILFAGCTSIPSKFVENDDYGYVSKCGFYIHESIDRKNLYLLKDDSRRIYIFKDNQYIISSDQYSIIVPIETCNKEWCKIYYPCSDSKYFVKKDDIVLFNGKTYWYD